MKVKYKITIGMICLLSLLFAVGGTALISVSFANDLDREKESARNSYQMIFNTLQLLDSAESWESAASAADKITPLLEQDVPKWSGVMLSTEDEVLYDTKDLSNTQISKDEAEVGKFSLTGYRDSSDRYQLLMSGSYLVAGEVLYIDVSRDITDIYDERNRQINVFKIIYGILIIVCAALALAVSWVLTRPLSKLTESAKEIANGNLSSRSEIKADDEIGILSSEFDNMAEKTEESINELKSSVERQDRFMGSFTHEIKTPMSSILGYSDLLRGGMLSEEEQAEAANFIFSESKRLENLSLKMLDIFVAEKTDIKRTQININDEIIEILTSMKFVLEEKKITVDVECDNKTFPVDIDLFRSLIINIVTNAINAMDESGRINLQCRINDNECIIKIRDNGKGIPDEYLDHVTEAFYRIDTSRSRKQGGAGLGLSLSSKIVELHNGKMSIESITDQGTTVIIILRREDETC